MGTVTAEFELQLARWDAEYLGRPREQLLKLCLLALEREEIVAVAYRDGALRRRLDRMPIPAEARELVHHALVWAWRDEDMHAVYVRGALVRVGGLGLRLQVWSQQAAGMAGGWASVVRQHVRWRDAPLSRALASAMTLAGTWSGRVPAPVRRYLDYGPFRAFCLFNVDAERTAWLCWDRMATLAEAVPGLERSAPDFRHVRDDEGRHERVFAAIADALDDDDRLAPGASVEQLAERLGAADESFLPRRRRRTRAGNPVGSGRPVVVVQGDASQGKRAALRSAVEAAGLREVVAERRPASEPLRAVIKAAFMFAYDRRDLSVVTDPELLDELALILRELGCAEVDVVEAANIYDRFHGRRSVAEVAAYVGLDAPSYRVVDGSAEQVPHTFGRGLGQESVSRAWRDASLRITFAKLRSHPVDVAHLSLANLEWLGTRCEAFLFTERQARRETALMMLLDDFPPHFALIEGWDSAADGVVGVMGCPSPPAPYRLYCGVDALAVDAVAARHVGLDDAADSGTLAAARDWFGHSGAAAVLGPDQPIAGWRNPYGTEISALLSGLAWPVYVTGSGRGSLFLPEMDEEAFPPLQRPSWALRAARSVVRRVIGLHLPRA